MRLSVCNTVLIASYSLIEEVSHQWHSVVCGGNSGERTHRRSMETKLQSVHRIFMGLNPSFPCLDTILWKSERCEPLVRQWGWHVLTSPEEPKLPTVQCWSVCFICSSWFSNLVQAEQRGHCSDSKGHTLHQRQTQSFAIYMQVTLMAAFTYCCTNAVLAQRAGKPRFTVKIHSTTHTEPHFAVTQSSLVLTAQPKCGRKKPEYQLSNTVSSVWLLHTYLNKGSAGV